MSPQKDTLCAGPCTFGVYILTNKQYANFRTVPESKQLSRLLNFALRALKMKHNRTESLWDQYRQFKPKKGLTKGYLCCVQTTERITLSSFTEKNPEITHQECQNKGFLLPATLQVSQIHLFEVLFYLTYCLYVSSYSPLDSNLTVCHLLHFSTAWLTFSIHCRLRCGKK